MGSFIGCFLSIVRDHVLVGGDGGALGPPFERKRRGVALGGPAGRGLEFPDVV
jgi:hypothetical protein